MAQKIIMPKQGLQMTEGTIIKWLVEEGGQVKEGDQLFEMETDKLTITIDSTATGTLLKIVHGEGDVVPIAETIAIVGEAGEDFSDLLPAGESKEKARDEAPAAAPAREPEALAIAHQGGGERRFVTPRARMRAGEKGINIDDVPGSGPEGLVIEKDVLNYAASAPKATPLAKKIAAQEGVSLADIQGTGSHGKIQAADIAARIAARTRGAARGERLIPLTGMRKIVAERMKASLTDMAQANHRMNVDMTEAVRIREQLKASGVKVSYNDIIIRCVAKALTEFPMMNSSMTGDGIVVKEYVNVGMAVAVENGLIVPVIKDADLMTLQEIGACSGELAAKAKENRLSPDDYTGGTFTVSNLGMFDVDSFTAVINPPEAGILAVGKIAKTPVVVNDEIVIRPIMTLSLTYDHRVVDGAPAAQFLKRIKELLQAPALLL